MAQVLVSALALARALALGTSTSTSAGTSANTGTSTRATLTNRDDKANPASPRHKGCIGPRSSRDCSLTDPQTRSTTFSLTFPSAAFHFSNLLQARNKIGNSEKGTKKVLILMLSNANTNAVLCSCNQTTTVLYCTLLHYAVLHCILYYAVRLQLPQAQCHTVLYWTASLVEQVRPVLYWTVLFLFCPITVLYCTMQFFRVFLEVSRLSWDNTGPHNLL